MLPRRLRLPRRGFSEIKGLRRSQSPHFSLSYSDCASVSGATVIIPKKAVRSSVDRHWLKRRLMPLLRPYLTPSRALILAVRPGTATTPYPELHNELNSLLRSILPTQ